MTKDDALATLVMYAHFRDHLPKVPGAVITRMSADTRAALARLTSDDLASVPRWQIDYAVAPKQTLAAIVDRKDFRLADFDARLIARRKHLDSVAETVQALP